MSVTIDEIKFLPLWSQQFFPVEESGDQAIIQIGKFVISGAEIHGIGTALGGGFVGGTGTGIFNVNAGDGNLPYLLKIPAATLGTTNGNDIDIQSSWSDDLLLTGGGFIPTQVIAIDFAAGGAVTPLNIQVHSVGPTFFRITALAASAAISGMTDPFYIVK